MPRHLAVHRHGVEFAQREVGRIGQVDEDDVKQLAAFFQPLRGIGVDDARFRVRECAAVQRGQCCRGGKGLRHLGIEINQGQALHLRVFQHFARGEAVTTAEDEDAFGASRHLHRGQDQRLVVARFVTRGELQVAVEIKAGVVLPAGDNEALVGRVPLIHDRVAEVALLGVEGDAVGIDEGGG